MAIAKDLSSQATAYLFRNTDKSVKNIAIFADSEDGRQFIDLSPAEAAALRDWLNSMILAVKE